MTVTLALGLVSSTAWSTLVATVSILTYPAFRIVAPQDFPRYHLHHSQRISVLVVPIVLGLLASTVTIASNPPPTASGLAIGAMLTGLLGSLAITFFAAVPLHSRLGTIAAVSGDHSREVTALRRVNDARLIFALIHLIGTLAVVLA